MASAQSEQVELSLGKVSTTQTSAGRIIEFKISLSRELTDSEVLGARIVFGNVLSSEIVRTGPVINYPISTCVGRFSLS